MVPEASSRTRPLRNPTRSIEELSRRGYVQNNVNDKCKGRESAQELSNPSIAANPLHHHHKSTLSPIFPARRPNHIHCQTSSCCRALKLPIPASRRTKESSKYINGRSRATSTDDVVGRHSSGACGEDLGESLLGECDKIRSLDVASPGVREAAFADRELLALDAGRVRVDVSSYVLAVDEFRQVGGWSAGRGRRVAALGEEVRCVRVMAWVPYVTGEFPDPPAIGRGLARARSGSRAEVRRYVVCMLDCLNLLS